MLTAEQAFDEARPRLLGLVQREERRAGSRMLAYDAVARAIGTSGSWVRKALRGTDDLGAPAWHVIENIRSAYEAACERIEADARLERERFLALGRPHAMADGTDRPMGMAARSSVPRTGRATVVVRPVVDEDGQ